MIKALSDVFDTVDKIALPNLTDFKMNPREILMYKRRILTSTLVTPATGE